MNNIDPTLFQQTPNPYQYRKVSNRINLPPHIYNFNPHSTFEKFSQHRIGIGPTAIQ
jgi:hypothetical protein